MPHRYPLARELNLALEESTGIVVKSFEYYESMESDFCLPYMLFSNCTGGDVQYEVQYGSVNERFAERSKRMSFMPVGERLRSSARIRSPLRFYLIAIPSTWLATMSHGQIDVAKTPMRGTMEIDDPFVRAAIESLGRDCDMPRSYCSMRAESIAIAMVCEFMRVQGFPSAFLPNGPVTSRKRFERIIDYIDAHLSEEISLEQLARVANLSRVHFLREFKRITGLPPHRFILKRRIEIGADLIRRGELPLKVIALNVGFSSQSHFGAAFRGRYGVTPSSFRNRTC
jgi:AraC-like DNA-binding protein